MKYLLDTNIISEFTKPTVDFYVLSWAQDCYGQLGTTAISLYEVYKGILLMPDGKRRERILSQVDAIAKDLAHKVAPFDAFSAYLAAQMAVDAKSAGVSPSVEDLMIAAIAKANGAVVATRNVKDFQPLGVQTFNPFDYSPPVYGRAVEP